MNYFPIPPERKKFNIYFPGHYDSMEPKNKYCPLDKSPLVLDKDKTLRCSRCGLPYKGTDDVGHSLEIKSKFGSSKERPKIMQANNKSKKLIAEDGNKIAEDDELIKQEIAQGKVMKSYREYLLK